MNVLVTGGAGFIGSNFIRVILKKHTDWKVINFDKLTYCGNLENLKDVEKNPHYSFVEGDICDEDAVSKVLNSVDLIFHFAAESHVDNSINDPYIFTKTNVIGTHVLLEQARKMKVKKFIHISTDEVYGSVQKGSSKETDVFEPNSPYSASKSAAEHLVRAYNVTFNLPTIITRSSNNFGPYQYPEKFIPLSVTNLLEGKKIPIYGDGLNVRDWLYVIDKCEAIDFVSQKGKIGEAYNIGGGNELPNMQIAKILLNATHKDDSSIEYVRDRPGHDRRYSLDSSKIHELGWKPRFNFQNAIKDTVDWYSQNEKWWRKLKRR